MAEMELARKYRPDSISGLWGNKESKEILTGLLEKDKAGKAIPHTLLFIGASGTGKTTSARAFFNDLGIGGADLTEINASDHNGVDDMRALIDSADYRPMMSDKKGIILDEVQMLSSNAQDAILKLLEEPPAYLYIALCTTDPQKIKNTIKTRAIKIELKTLPSKTMVRCLSSVMEEEDQDWDMEVLEAIAEKSEGVPRTALKLMDKVLGMDTEKALAVVAKETGADEEDPDIRALCQKLLKQADWKEVSPILKKIKGQDAEAVRRIVAGYMSAVLLNSGDIAAATVLSYFTDSFFASGYAGLVLACFSAVNDK